MSGTAAAWRSPAVLSGLALGVLGGFWLSQGRLLRGAAAVGMALLVLAIFRSRRRRYVGFAVATVVLATLLPVTAILGLDLYLHHRYAESGGYNVWGYRGEAVGAKEPGERRLAVLGGSAAFGYGVRADEAFPAYLEQNLNGRGDAKGQVRVVNLAWNGEGAFAFPFTLDAYDYLDADAVLLYSGYNDLAVNTQDFRKQSAIFRATGYMPILPVLPINSWLRIRDLSETREEDRVVFRPNLVDRSAAQAADMALQVTRALERQLERLAKEGPARPASGAADDCGRWAHYCESMQQAVEIALAQGRHVVVVTEPYVGGGGKAASLHINQQSTLKNMLAARFSGEPRLHYVNMGRAVDLSDPALCYDGLHLTPAGNAKLAAHLATALGPVLEALDTRGDETQPVKFPATPGAEEKGESATPLDVERAAAAGQLRAARAAAVRVVDEATRDGDAQSAGLVMAKLAVAEWAAGNHRDAVAAVEQALALHDGADVLWVAALIHALAGDLSTAETVGEQFGRTAPERLMTRRLWGAVLDAAVANRRGDSELALMRLDATLPYDRASFWPRYLRGLIHLEHGRGFEAEEEFLRILAQPELGPHDPLYVTSHRHLASARVQQGAAALYGETYQAFFKAWRQADAGLPLLEEAKREYLELRRSIGMPPLPF